MRFGVFLPSFILPGHEPTHGDEIRAFARRAEELGFDALWITDHIVTARRFYRVGWLDALMTLSHVAAVTDRVRLGTSILILPVRQPAVLAKEIATLHALSGGRYIFGIGTAGCQILGRRPTPALANYRVPSISALYLTGPFMHPGGTVTLGGRPTAMVVYRDLGIPLKQGFEI